MPGPPDGVPRPSDSRWRETAFRIVALASRFIVSPNSYGLGAPLASTPVAISRVSCRPRLLLPIDPSRSRSARYPRKSRLLSVISNLNVFSAPPNPAPGPLPPLPIALDIRRGGDVALLLQLLDDPVDELVEALFRVVAILPALAEHLLERLVGQETAVQQRLEDRVVQRLHRSAVLAGHPVRVVEPARQQEIGQPREQLLEVELVEVLAGVLGIAVFHVSTGSARQL